MCERQTGYPSLQVNMYICKSLSLLLPHRISPHSPIHPAQHTHTHTHTHPKTATQRNEPIIPHYVTLRYVRAPSTPLLLSLSLSAPQNPHPRSTTCPLCLRTHCDIDAIVFRGADLLARLLDLVEHGVKGDGGGVDVCGLGFEGDGVGCEACWVFFSGRLIREGSGLVEMRGVEGS